MPVSGGRDRVRGTHSAAFANIWPGPRHREELSIDLMRYHRDALQGRHGGAVRVLDAVGHAHGYRRFALGMAPLSGLEFSRWIALEPAGRVPVRVRRADLQLPGPPRQQGEVQSHLGAALSRVPWRPRLPRIMAMSPRWSLAATGRSLANDSRHEQLRHVLSAVGDRAARLGSAKGRRRPAVTGWREAMTSKALAGLCSRRRASRSVRLLCSRSEGFATPIDDMRRFPRRTLDEEELAS